jgi:transcriptional regulator with XRE-family HTH domain
MRARLALSARPTVKISPSALGSTPPVNSNAMLSIGSTLDAAMATANARHRSWAGEAAASITREVIGGLTALYYDGATMNTPTVTNGTNITGRAAPSTPIGGLLRTWRERRRLSQLELAGAADISARHVSFLETGRSLPSREMLLRLAERLEVPLRERNALLLSAGYAPMYSERRLDDPALRQAQEAVELVLAGHEPYPALAVDRHWNLVELLAELELYPRPPASDGSMEQADETDYGGVVVPMRVLTEYGTLSFFGTTTVFGAPLDITLAELAIESFFPADRATAQLLAQAARSNGGQADGQP